MVRCWIVLVLVISPMVNAWKSSTEDHREPTDYRKDPTPDQKAPEYRRESTQDRRTPTKERRDLTKERRDPIQERRGFIQDRKDSTEYRRDRERRDSTGYRREPRELRRTHYQTKRHMLPETEPKKRSTTLKPNRDVRKKPSGHLTPLEDDDMENDEVVSVAIGPPPLRGKFEKPRKKPVPKPSTPPTPSAVALVKDLFTQITKEFLSRDVDENFVFGQYLGNAMKNLTSELRLSMQHEVLELIVKYQKANQGDAKTEVKNTQVAQMLKDLKVDKKFASANDTEHTEENWPDFSNLAKIVG